MGSIAGSNALYNSYRNSIVGMTTDYSTRVDCDTDTLFSFFSDDGTVTPDDTDVFVTTYDTSINPAFTPARQAPLTVTAGIVATGVVDADDYVFDGATVLTGATSVESYIIAKYITNSAASPVLAHFGNATGLSGGLTPNGAAVTVVFNASGIWKF